MLCELQQACCCDQFLGEPIPVPDHFLSEEAFPNIQYEPLLTQLQAIPMGPISGQQGE